jgi:hypothetical protein
MAIEGWLSADGTPADPAECLAMLVVRCGKPSAIWAKVVVLPAVGLQQPGERQYKMFAGVRPYLFIRF